MNAAGELEFVSRQSMQYFGKTAEELNHWATSDGIHPEDLPRMIQAWKQAIETGQPIEVEHRSRRVDGVYRWFLLRGRPQRDLEGRVIRWYNLVTDIDDRKRAEEKVQTQRSVSVRSPSTSVTRVASAAKFPSGEMFWSEETFRIFGYSSTTKPTVEAILQRVHPEDRETVHAQIDKARIQRNNCDLEFRLSLPNGSVKRVSRRCACSPCGCR
jgi:PAS domain S-box-containing protein